MSITIYPDPEKLSEAAAHLFLQIAKDAVKNHGRFTVALAGGGSPKRTYELLTSEPLKSQIPWEKTFIFWGDERFVPSDDPENNARMAREVLLDHVPVLSKQIFPTPTNGKPKEAAKRYASTLASVFENELPRFDLILLGLGENGHTASLFPETDVLEEKSKWVDAVYIKDKEQFRITLTAPVINQARNVAFIAFGESKAETVAAVIEGTKKTRQLPAQLIRPKNGSLYWLLDEAAGQYLKANDLTDPRVN